MPWYSRKKYVELKYSNWTGPNPFQKPTRDPSSGLSFRAVYFLATPLQREAGGTSRGDDTLNVLIGHPMKWPLIEDAMLMFDKQTNRHRAPAESFAATAPAASSPARANDVAEGGFGISPGKGWVILEVRKMKGGV
ncbi:hypothetical protein TNCV_3147231 [Trichonephila clavipes]|nr:hypothetical protein TNCV_3147231 [Trichonephila clavipes]